MSTAEQVSRRSVPDAATDAASRRTVNVALASNATIAVAKLAAGLMTGSSAMLAETAHSIADTVNQAFLRMSLTLGAEEPTPEHPFGHGQERFLWTLMAAVGMFLATLSFLLTTPGVWEPSLGGFPALSALPGQFLIKDLALLGISLWTLGEAWQVSEQRG